MEEPTTPGGQSTTGHFRESDMDFLRAQAREWLEAVLGEDFDDDTSLEDLLADGSLLYRAAQHIKEDSKFPGYSESASHPASGSPSVDRRNSFKYQPYASVESFLKVCKEVGLQDLDVFDSSDAVDKKDIRRVCVCLRRLSKKGRTLGIQVPDFDNVKDTLVTPSKMPREAVRRTQESLQKSSSRSSRSGVNGLVSSETSSLIADLRKDDAESDKIETDNRVERLPLADLDGEDRTTKKAAPLVSIRSGVDSTHGPAPKATELIHSPVQTLQEHDSPDYVDRNGEEAAVESSTDSTETQEALAATEATADLPVEALLEDMPQVTPSEATTEGKLQVNPSEAAIEEKLQEESLEESQKGLFIAHLKGTEPYVKKEVNETKKEDDKNGGFPWTPFLGGAVAIVGGIAGALFFKTRSGNELESIIISDRDGESVYSGGLYDVIPGDNLTQIAKKSGKKHWREIADKNSFIANPDLIYPGDRLKL